MAWRSSARIRRTGESPGRCKEGWQWRRYEEQVPGDVSAAAFWLVAGAIHPDAELTLHDVGVNPTRRAVIDILRSMGADIDERAARDAPDDGIGEPIADLVVRSSELRGVDLGPADVAAAIDEVPVLCLAAALARGTTTIRGAGELRHKESDRIAGIAAGLRALGARIRIDGDDLRIDGGATPARRRHRQPRRPPPGDDLRDRRPDRPRVRPAIARPGSAAISYPGFFDDLERVRA